MVDELHWLWMKNEWNPFMMMLASLTTYVINNGMSKHFFGKGHGIEINWIQHYRICDNGWCKKNSKINSNKVFSQVLTKGNDAPPNSLKDSNVSLKVKTTEEKKEIGVRSLIRSTLGVKKHVGVMGWRLRQMTSKSIIHTNVHKPNNKLVNA